MAYGRVLLVILVVAAALVPADGRAADDEKGLFLERCRICHGSMPGLAKIKLILRDGRLMGRYTGRDMAAFLPVHGVRSAKEAAFFLERLTHLRQRIEAGKPVGGKQRDRAKRRARK